MLFGHVYNYMYACTWKSMHMHVLTIDSIM